MKPDPKTRTIRELSPDTQWAVHDVLLAFGDIEEVITQGNYRRTTAGIAAMVQHGLTPTRRKPPADPTPYEREAFVAFVEEVNNQQPASPPRWNALLPASALRPSSTPPASPAPNTVASRLTKRERRPNLPPASRERMLALRLNHRPSEVVDMMKGEVTAKQVDTHFRAYQNELQRKVATQSDSTAERELELVKKAPGRYHGDEVETLGRLFEQGKTVEQMMAETGLKVAKIYDIRSRHLSKRMKERKVGSASTDDAAASASKKNTASHPLSLLNRIADAALVSQGRSRQAIADEVSQDGQRVERTTVNSIMATQRYKALVEARKMIAANSTGSAATSPFSSASSQQGSLATASWSRDRRSLSPVRELPQVEPSADAPLTTLDFPQANDGLPIIPEDQLRHVMLFEGQRFWTRHDGYFIRLATTRDRNAGENIEGGDFQAMNP